MRPHVLFDLDGTLTDSAPGITRCLAHAIRAVGASAPPLDTLRPWIGTPLREIFRAVLPETSHARMDDAVAAYVERFDRVGIRENDVFPGVKRALEALTDAGCTLYVATAKGQDVAERVVAQFELGSLFRGVFGAHFDRGITSKTDVLRHALGAGAIPAPAAAMVGDRRHDVDAAHALGVRAIGVAWGYGPREELSAAHEIAASPEELVRLIADAREREYRSLGTPFPLIAEGGCVVPRNGAKSQAWVASAAGMWIASLPVRWSGRPPGSRRDLEKRECTA